MIYFIRHGQADYSEKDSKIYQGFGNHMAPLSPRGIQEIEETATDPRLQRAKLILSSPYGRALQSAAILSRRLQLPLQVETDLHEWLANKRYHYLSEEQSNTSLQWICDLQWHLSWWCRKKLGIYPCDAPAGSSCLGSLSFCFSDHRRLSWYWLIQSLCGYHPQNGEIVEFSLSSDNVD